MVIELYCVPVLSGEAETEAAAASSNKSAAKQVCSADTDTDASPPDYISLPVSREGLCPAQRTDPTVKTCFSRVVSADKAKGEKILLCKWSPSLTADADWSVVYQVVVPAGYRQHVLSVAHESQWSGH